MEECKKTSDSLSVASYPTISLIMTARSACSDNSNRDIIYKLSNFSASSAPSFSSGLDNAELPGD